MTVQYLVWRLLAKKSLLRQWLFWWTCHSYSENRLKSSLATAILLMCTRLRTLQPLMNKETCIALNVSRGLNTIILSILIRKQKEWLTGRFRIKRMAALQNRSNVITSCALIMLPTTMPMQRRRSTGVVMEEWFTCIMIASRKDS